MLHACLHVLESAARCQAAPRGMFSSGIRCLGTPCQRWNNDSNVSVALPYTWTSNITDPAYPCEMRTSIFLTVQYGQTIAGRESGPHQIACRNSCGTSRPTTKNGSKSVVHYHFRKWPNGQNLPHQRHISIQPITINFSPPFQQISHSHTSSQRATATHPTEKQLLGRSSDREPSVLGSETDRYAVKAVCHVLDFKQVLTRSAYFMTNLICKEMEIGSAKVATDHVDSTTGTSDCGREQGDDWRSIGRVPCAVAPWASGRTLDRGARVLRARRVYRVGRRCSHPSPIVSTVIVGKIHLGLPDGPALAKTPLERCTPSHAAARRRWMRRRWRRCGVTKRQRCVRDVVALWDPGLKGVPS